MKFIPLEEKFSWGEISHMIADLGYLDSILKEGWLAGNSIGELMDMYVDRVSGEKAFGFYGRQFPLCVRVIDAKKRMPLTVHPDDETAGPRFDFLGKSKLWYVLSAGPGGRISYGFNTDADASQVYTSCLDGSVYGMLNNIPVQPGDSFHILPGTVHCAEDVVLLEICESSPLDFVLCDWGRGESDPDNDSLGLVEALDMIDYRAARKPVPSDAGLLADSDEIVVRKMRLEFPLHVDRDDDSFAVYCCVSGNASVQVASENGIIQSELKSGESVLVPAEVESLELVPHTDGTVLLEAYVRKGAGEDGYINPDVEDTPEDGEFTQDDENYMD